MGNPNEAIVNGDRCLWKSLSVVSWDVHLACTCVVMVHLSSQHVIHSVTQTMHLLCAGAPSGSQQRHGAISYGTHHVPFVANTD